MRLLKRNDLIGALATLMLVFLALIIDVPRASCGEDLAGIRESAEQGVASSQYTMGVRCGNGNGVPQNDVAAYAWFSLAAAQGNENAAEHKYIIAKRFTPEQRGKAQALIAEFQTKIDKQTNAPSSSQSIVTSEADLRAWLQSIKPAAGGK